MKTLLIYSGFEDLPTFAIVDGDWSQYNELVINTYYEDEDPRKKLVEEMCDKLFEPDTGKNLVEFASEFPLGQHFDKVANIGFVP